jgi:carbon monoxide dehydrogenase subunit G
MIFEFGGSPELPSPREAVWRHLQDGDTLAACTPGAESFEVRGPGRYSVKCGVGSGLVRVQVVLEAELHDLVHPESLRLRAQGTGPGSTLDVDTTVRLEAIGPERTRLEWRSTTGVHGMLAKFGRGMVEDVLRRFTETFWQNVAARLAAAPRTGAYRLSAAELLALPAKVLPGAVVLAGIDLDDRTLGKGRQLDPVDAAALLAAARLGALPVPVRLAWADTHELHEEEAARRLASAAIGPGASALPPHQGRVDVVAARRGVLALSAAGLKQVNAVDPLEVFTRWEWQPVESGEAIASVKVAPHIVALAAVEEGVRRAREHAPLIDVAAYTGATVASVVAEPLAADARARFEAASRLRAESLGGTFLGVWDASSDDPERAEASAHAILTELAHQRRAPVLLVGGVSAGDVLAPLFAALEVLGGSVVRRGVPAHPGSMLWLGRLGDSQILGLPRCGVFDMASVADLLLPRMMTGEILTAESVAGIGHGGLLGREMRSRFPAYARELPDAPSS